MDPLPALSDDQAVAAVVWLTAADVPQGDPRLIDELRCRALAGDARCFAAWLDGSLAFVVPTPQLSPALIVGFYRLARVRLESLANRRRFDFGASAFLQQWQPRAAAH